MPLTLTTTTTKMSTAAISFSQSVFETLFHTLAFHTNFSRFFRPCKLVPRFHVPQFPPVQTGAANSCLAFSVAPFCRGIPSRTRAELARFCQRTICRRSLYRRSAHEHCRVLYPSSGRNDARSIAIVSASLLLNDITHVE